jgi:hypothetical protein
MTLIIPLQIDYCLQLCHDAHARAESAPVLHLWLTQDVSRQYAVLELDESGTGSLRTTLSLPLVSDQRTPDPTYRAALDAISKCNLNLDAQVLVNNQHREMCRVPAGQALLPLAYLFRAQNNNGVRAELAFPMIAPANGGVKGTATLTLTGAVTLNGNDVQALMHSAGLQWMARNRVVSPCETYIERAEQRYSPDGILSTWHSLDNVNMFRYVTHVGVLPAAAYLQVPVAPTTERFFLNAARLALRRMEVTEDEALAWTLTVQRDARRAAYWLAHVLQLYDQYCDYIEDMVVAPVPAGSLLRGRSAVQFTPTPIEWFQYVRTRDGSGDCEDLASETQILARELQQLRTGHPLLLRLKEVLDGFYVVLLLDGVSSVEINLAPSANPGHMDAHMNSALISRWHARTWIASPASSSSPSAIGRPLQSYPPIVMMEGTGPLDPDGTEHAHADEVAEELREQLIGAFRPLKASTRQIFHYDSSGHAQSSFYKTVKLIGSSMIERNRFLWLLCPDASMSKCGVSFQAIAAGDPRIRAMGEHEIGDADLLAIADYKLDLHPLPPLDGPDESASALQDTPAAVRRARAQMDDARRQIDALVAAERPRFMHAGDVAPSVAHRSVIMVKYAHFDDAGQFAATLVSAVRSAATRGVPLVGWRADEERVTADRGGYRIVMEWPEVALRSQPTKSIDRYQ